MSISFIQPNAQDVQDISIQLARLNAIEAARAEHEGASLPGVYWSEVSQIAKGGSASSYYSVGDQFVDTYTDPDADTTTTYSQPWDVLDFRDVTKNDESTASAIIVGTHYNQLVDMQFSGWQAFIYSATGLPAGTYNFTAGATFSNITSGTTYEFTLTEALPAGGQIVPVNSWAGVSVSSWTFTTYSSASSTTAIETVSVTEGSDGTSLGTAALQVPTDTTTVTVDSTDYTCQLNGLHQASYGYNRWKYSAVRQYLNSDAAAGEWWSPQHVFDRAPSVASTKAGWLAGCTDDFKNALTAVQVITAVNTAQATAEGITYDTTYDKVFIPSLEEHYIAYQITGEGDPYAYWENLNGTSTKYAWSTATSDLIKYSLSSTTTAKARWLRSAHRGYGCGEWRITSSGGVNNTNAAHNSYGSAPVCAIC